MVLKVGYIGLGAMGGSLASHLIDPFDLTVLDRNPAAVEPMVLRGAMQAANAATLARDCDIIVLCLPRTVNVRDAIFSQGGLVEGLSAGKLVIDQTSGIPEETNAIAKELAGMGVLMLDAPVSGGIPAAQARQITVIASGSDVAWQKGGPVLRAMTDKVFRCSERVGDGQALKLVNNAIGAGYRMATLELVALGRKAGIGLAGIVKRLNSGPAANFTTRHMLAGLVEGRSTTNFALSLMVKDLNEALALGWTTSSAMPLTAGARGLMQIGVHLIGVDAKLDDAIPLTEKLALVSLRGEGIDDDTLLCQLETAVLVCNVIAVGECVSMGRRFGLDPMQMARILIEGSAWSHASEGVLQAFARGCAAELPQTLGDAQAALAALSRKAGEAGSPFLLPAQALTIVQTAFVRHGPSDSIGKLVHVFDGAL